MRCRDPSRSTEVKEKQIQKLTAADPAADSATECSEGSNSSGFRLDPSSHELGLKVNNVTREGKVEPISQNPKTNDSERANYRAPLLPRLNSFSV